MGNPTTAPADKHDLHTAPRLIVEPAYIDPKTGAVYVHKDLELALKPWEAEQHISPTKAAERFGDVESWVAYVRRFANESTPPLLTWSELGLAATLDYHGGQDAPGRAQWTAYHPFQRSPQWRAWEALANGDPRSQKMALEALEDLAEDIVEPDAASLVQLLRTLRATASAEARTELRADGTTSVSFSKDNRVQTGEVELPPEIAVAIPVLKGHTEEKDGRLAPVLYRLPVRLRASVDDRARLSLRFSMPTAERVLESVFADRVAQAIGLLGEGFPLLRAAA